MIAQLVTRMLADTPAQDIYVFQGHMGDGLVAAAIFTRLSYPDDPQSVFILSPMAVDPAHQRQGHGQALLRNALHSLAHQGVDVAVTYGDPAYYGQIGFRPMTTEQAQPPLPLSMPIGWIGQTLPDGDEVKLVGPSTCIDALNDPSIW